ncbi:MAG: type II secretion system F family protein [Ruminococcaceae bacterium]|nr:type II secretion system F family protein [Oscillospiraceae bacterium]
MPTYGYVAVDRYGKKKKGSLFADDPQHLKKLIKHDGYTLVEYKEQGVMTRDIDLPFLDRVKDRDLSVFARQFVSMLSAGVPIATSLQMLGAQTENKRLKAALLNTKTEIEKGETLTDAMKKQGYSIFPEIMINMVKAGEASGNLEVAFNRLASYFEKRNKTRAAIKKAMIYPCVVICVVVIVMIIMIAVVLPKFKNVFESAGADLPGITKALLAISDWLTSNWLLAAIIVAAVVAAFILFGKTDKGRHIYDKIALKVPIFGILTTKSEAAMFARTAATLLKAGLPMLQTIEICSENMTNIYFRESLERAKEEVSVGTPFASGIEMGGYFPPLVSHMVGIGEETGGIEEMLDKVAEYYDEETEVMTASMMSLMEPFIMVLMATCVGFIVIAILVPMFSMYDHLG